jgi:lipopolysaccharide heptosyltransferase I
MPLRIAARRILIIRPSALGDVCRSVPVLDALRRAAPDGSLHWLVQAEFAPVIQSHPALDGIVPFPRSAWRGLLGRPDRWKSVVSFLRSLRRGRFDLVIDCQGLARSGLMALATGASRRVGDRSSREGAWLTYTDAVSVPDGVHEVDRMLALAAAAGAEPDGAIDLYVPPEAADRWTRRRRDLGLDGQYVVLAPATRWASKAWPAGYWSSLGRQLLDMDASLRLVLVGSPGEQAVSGAVAAGLHGVANRVIDLSGRTCIGELMALIEDATLTIASDSAPLHMAVGLGGRYLGLYGPTDPAVVGPWHGEDKIIVAPRDPDEHFDYRNASLGDSVMRRIGIGDVFERAAEAMGYGL